MKTTVLSILEVYYSCFKNMKILVIVSDWMIIWSENASNEMTKARENKKLEMTDKVGNYVLYCERVLRVVLLVYKNTIYNLSDGVLAMTNVIVKKQM